MQELPEAQGVPKATLVVAAVTGFGIITGAGFKESSEGKQSGA